MQEVHRAGLFRRNSGRACSTCSARGPSTGMPTRTQQCDLISCAYASHGDTKHVLLFPEDPAEAFEFGAAGVRSCRPAADADLRHARSRHRHEPPAVRGRLKWDDSTALRPRQGDDGGGPGSRPGLRPLPGCRRRRHSATAPIRARIRPRARSSPAAPRATATRRYTEDGAPTSTTCSGCCASSRPRRTWCRGRCRPMPASRPKYGVIYFGSTAPAMDEAIRPDRGPRPSAGPACAFAASRSIRSVDQLRRRPRFRLRGRAEPRRAAALADRQRMRRRSGAAGADPALSTARRSPRASSPRRSAIISTS